ncbi:MAG: metal-dependent transcriptional regulator, partial [Clostridia bacterium]
MSNLSKSNEDYLETIYILSLDDKNVKSIKIATQLNVSRPAVNKAMNELLDFGLIDKTSYSGITLTDAGRLVAEEIYGKHLVIKQFLIRIGVSEHTAEIDCCKIEHVV